MRGRATARETDKQTGEDARERALSAWLRNKTSLTCMQLAQKSTGAAPVDAKEDPEMKEDPCEDPSLCKGREVTRSCTNNDHCQFTSHSQV